jgi:hypothetical protein
VKRADPLSAAPHPRRRIGGVELNGLAVDRHSLVHLVRDDGDIVAEHPHLHVAVELEFVEGVGRALHHLEHRLLVELADSLRTRHDARIGREAFDHLDVVVLQRLPILPLEIDELFLDFLFHFSTSWPK